MTTLTTHDLAERFRCLPRKVREAARTYGIGSNFGGRAGFRFSEVDADLLFEAMRIPTPVARRRKRRAA